MVHQLSKMTLLNHFSYKVMILLTTKLVVFFKLMETNFIHVDATNLNKGWFGVHLCATPKEQRLPNEESNKKREARVQKFSKYCSRILVSIIYYKL